MEVLNETRLVYVVNFSTLNNFCSFFRFSKKSYAETNTVSSTVVNNTPPTANAPVLPNSNSDICKVGVEVQFKIMC